MSSKAKCSGSSQHEDGFTFQFEAPREDLSLQGVCIEEGVPALLFKVAKKVPTLTEEDVATCIRLSQDNKRPEFFYNRFLPDHPLAGTGRHYKQYKPSYLKRTSIGEALAEIDWHMKCLDVGVRGDKEKGVFNSWAKTSNLDGLVSYEDFPIDTTKPSSVFMVCKDVCTHEDKNQLVFAEEPKMAIEEESNPGFSEYITEIFDSVAYYDEPLFLKMKEIIKLIVAAEWLRDKEVQFSKEWLKEHSNNLQDAPKPLRVELSEEEITSITKQMLQAAEKELKSPALKQPLSLSKFKDKYPQTVTKPKISVKNGCFEIDFEKTFADPTFEVYTDLYVPVVQKFKLRATVTDFDFLYQGMDPNIPVTLDTDGELVHPEVGSWSELFGETEPFPCKWLQDPNNPNRRTPALAGGVCTSNIPVRNVLNPVPVSSKNTVRVNASKGSKRQQVRSRDIPAQPVVNTPPMSVPVSSQESLRNAIARSGAQEMYGHEDYASCFGVSGDGQTIVKQPSLHCSGEIRELIGGKEVGPPLRPSMHLRLPPQKEPGDSAYSSVASTPCHNPQQPQLPGAQPDKDDSYSVTSDSGVSTATNDTLCSFGSSDTLMSDMDMN